MRIFRPRARRIGLRVAMALAALLTAAIATFAIPVPTWRTGELPATPLALIQGGPVAEMPRRVWIDTDAACGYSRRTDPDDCFAILLLARTQGLEIAGISTVYGNAPLDVTDRTARELAASLREGIEPWSVSRGSVGPMGEDGRIDPEPAHGALRKALAEGPLTLVSLGPLTNVAAALQGRPDLQANVTRLVAVMGRRPGHLFHPAEGAGGGILLGHGPVFRDFNFDMDRRAARAVLDMQLPTTFVPYDAAREISLNESDLTRLEAQGGAAAWVASRARGWIDFWKQDIGRDGFYPFDLLASAYVVAPGLFDCAETTAWVSKDRRLWNLFVYDPHALLVGPDRERPEDARSSRVVYCPQIAPQLHAWIMSRFSTISAPAGNVDSNASGRGDTGEDRR